MYIPDFPGFVQLFQVEDTLEFCVLLHLYLWEYWHISINWVLHKLGYRYTDNKIIIIFLIPCLPFKKNEFHRNRIIRVSLFCVGYYIR